jgi:hypothetical protein
MAFAVFTTPGLFAHEHDFGVWRAFAENGLSSTLPDIATSTQLHGMTQIFERCARLNKIGG